MFTEEAVGHITVLMNSSLEMNRHKEKKKIKKKVKKKTKIK